MNNEELNTGAKLINKYGEEMQINNELFEDELDTCFPNLVTIHNNLELKTEYTLDIYKYTDYTQKDFELVETIAFDKEPTDKEIIYYLAKHKLLRHNGFAEVSKTKVLDWKE